MHKNSRLKNEILENPEDAPRTQKNKLFTLFPLKRMPSTFRTLERQSESLNPSSKSVHYPKLSALSAPHVESFNSIFDLGGSPGILERAVLDIGKLAIFDTKTEDASPNKLESNASQNE